MLQCVGEEAAGRLWLGSDDKAPDGTYTLFQVTTASRASGG